jgi:hypothetical protein
LTIDRFTAITELATNRFLADQLIVTCGTATIAPTRQARE